MTTRALSKRPRSYTLKEDRGKEDAPVFEIRSVDIFEVAEISGDAAFGVGMSLKATTKNIKDYLKLGLMGWKNLKDIDGTEVPFKIENFQLLPFAVLTELVSQMSGTVTEEEEKNSETPSESPSG